MDRKAWIILFLCGIGLVLNYKLNVANKQNIEKPTQEQVGSGVGETLPPDAESVEKPSGDLVTEKPSLATEFKDEPHQLIGKDGEVVDVIYTFTNFGGGVKTAEFPGQKLVNGQGNVKLNSYSSHPVGALADDYKKIDGSYYEIVSKDASHITYSGRLGGGLEVIKKWSLIEGEEAKGYRLHLDVSFKNKGNTAVNLSDWGIFTGTAAPLFGKEQPDKTVWFYYADGEFEYDNQGPFTGGMFSDAKSVESIKASGLEYVGVQNQFFTTFIMPKGFQSDSIWATGREELIPHKQKEVKRWVFTMGMDFPSQQLHPSNEQSYSVDIFMGPRERNLIAAVGPNTADVMNYGWFSWFANIMASGLSYIHGWFAGASWSWGVSIILLTVFIRILIWPLHNKSTRTMKRMSKLQPIMKEMREKYADNPQKLNQETMQLYRKYGVNPMGGCLPMLVQIPIFFGVFKMLGAAVEMRGSSFLWVDDLAQADNVGEIFGLPINVLPIIMALTMVLQMRLTPQTGDKLQRRIFMLMPLMFFFFCYNYAAALALYWSTQNIVSIGQTLLMQRLPEPELEERGSKPKDDGKPRKKGMFEKLAEKLEAQQKMVEAAKKNSGKGSTSGMKQAKKPSKGGSDKSA